MTLIKENKMACSLCGKNHNISFHLEKNIARRGYPTDSKNYQEAHKQADKAEKLKYPKGYEEMKKVDNSLSKKELAGKNTKTGRIDVSKKVPPRLRQEVAFHEKTESKNLKRMKK